MGFPTDQEDEMEDELCLRCAEPASGGVTYTTDGDVDFYCEHHLAEELVQGHGIEYGGEG